MNEWRPGGAGVEGKQRKIVLINRNKISPFSSMCPMQPSTIHLPCICIHTSDSSHLISYSINVKGHYESPDRYSIWWLNEPQLQELRSFYSSFQDKFLSCLSLWAAKWRSTLIKNRVKCWSHAYKRVAHIVFKPWVEVRGACLNNVCCFIPLPPVGCASATRTTKLFLGQLPWCLFFCHCL